MVPWLPPINMWKKREVGKGKTNKYVKEMWSEWKDRGKEKENKREMRKKKTDKYVKERWSEWRNREKEKENERDVGK